MRAAIRSVWRIGRSMALWIAMASCGTTPSTLTAETNGPVLLTLAEARARTLQFHPRISVAELRSMASRNRVDQERAGWFPQVNGAVTAVGSDDPTGVHIAAGSLNAPGVYERAGVGAAVSQLITDFGRTANRVEAARLESRSAATNVLATRQQLLMELDGAYFAALRARVVAAVAAKTLSTRLQLLDQVSVLASNRLRSELDVRFAQVGVDEGRLMVSRSSAELDATRTSLVAFLGAGLPGAFELVEEGMPAAPAVPVSSLVAMALARRPDLVSQRLESESARRRAAAIGGLQNPTVSVFGAAGVVPMHDDHFRHEYAAAGLNLSIPLFAGGLYRAREEESKRLAEAAAAGVTEAEIRVIRDVRLAWSATEQARAELTLSRSLVGSASGALELARARFDQGLTSIVELNQAELNLVRAEIGASTALYDLRLRSDGLAFAAGDLH